jgi:UDP-N-acetylmuramyl pentapeptide phosphotransferase/UDP-N-acetylglucosamine-1-phosphate transferase
VATWLLAIATGCAASVLVLGAGRGVLASPALMRENYRRHSLPTAGGLIMLLGLLVVESGRSVVGAAGIGGEPGLTIERTLVLFAVLGFGFLGLFDDLLATGESRGFRGHLGAAVRGRITTGFVKLAGGGMVAVILVATPGFADGRRLILDAVLVAVCANLANLFDRAPGRTVKVGLLAYVPLAIALGSDPVGVAIAPVMGGAVALFGADLRERLMLGDTGANIIGAVLGLGVVLGVESAVTRGIILGVVVALNVVSEFVSFSRIIERVAVLRTVDRWGRRRDQPISPVNPDGPIADSST